MRDEEKLGIIALIAVGGIGGYLAYQYSKENQKKELVEQAVLAAPPSAPTAPTVTPTEQPITEIHFSEEREDVKNVETTKVYEYEYPTAKVETYETKVEYVDGHVETYQTQVLVDKETNEVIAVKPESAPTIGTPQYSYTRIYWI